MTGSEPDKHYATDPNVLEVRAAEFIRRLGSPEQTGHLTLHDEQRARLTRIRRRALIWAAVAGILSGGIIGGAEVIVMRGYLEGLEEMDWQEQLPYWAAFMAFVGIVSGIEILFLYWNSLKAVSRTSATAGWQLEPAAHGELLARGLSRAALEFPNPREPVYGIDPYARTSGWKLTAIAVLYRLKVGVTSFVLRVLLRRILARATLRFFIPLIAGPLYAAWNAWITLRIIREGRLRALAPYAVEALIEQLRREREHLRPQHHRLLAEIVAEVMIRSEDGHPNFVFLLSRLIEEFDIDYRRLDVDWASELEQMDALNERERRALLKVLTLTCLLDGNLTAAKITLLTDVYERCGLEFRPDALARMRAKLLEGIAIEDEDYAAVAASGERAAAA
jgi:hypothetical protein